MLLNTASGPLADPAVRARGRQGRRHRRHRRRRSTGAVVPTKGVIPPGLLGHSDELTGTGLDLEGAAALLAEAGYGPDGEPLNLTMTIAVGRHRPDAGRRQPEVQPGRARHRSRGRGHRVAGRSGTAPSVRTSRSARTSSSMYWWPDYPDPFSWFISMFYTEEEPTFNLAYYSDPDMDAAIDEIQSLTVTDRDGRRGQVHRDAAAAHRRCGRGRALRPELPACARCQRRRLRRRPGLRAGPLRLRHDARWAD